MRRVWTRLSASATAGAGALADGVAAILHRVGAFLVRHARRLILAAVAATALGFTAACRAGGSADALGDFVQSCIDGFLAPFRALRAASVLDGVLSFFEEAVRATGREIQRALLASARALLALCPLALLPPATDLANVHRAPRHPNQLCEGADTHFQTWSAQWSDYLTPMAALGIAGNGANELADNIRDALLQQVHGFRVCDIDVRFEHGKTAKERISDFLISIREQIYIREHFGRSLIILRNVDEWDGRDPKGDSARWKATMAFVAELKKRTVFWILKHATEPDGVVLLSNVALLYTLPGVALDTLPGVALDTLGVALYTPARSPPDKLRGGWAASADGAPKLELDSAASAEETKAAACAWRERAWAPLAATEDNRVDQVIGTLGDLMFVSCVT